MANIPVENPSANPAAFASLAAALSTRLVFPRIEMNNAGFSASWRDDGTGKLGWYVGASGAGDGSQIKALTVDPATGALLLLADPTNAMGAVTKQYADSLIAANDAMVFKGVIDCSSNPNYPAADRGWTYRVSVAGKIGGASGVNVESGDLLICLTDGTASGNQATVGANWTITQTNIDGAVTLTGAQTLSNKTLDATTVVPTASPASNNTQPANTAYVDNAVGGSGLPVGSSITYNGLDTPTNYLEEDGASYSSATYAALFSKLVKSSTVTMTIAAPAVISWASHGLKVGYPIKFTTTGALPTGLVVGTTYWIISAGFTASSFQISATPGGTAITTTGSQSGVHTGICAPHGCANNLSTFNVPQTNGIFVRGFDNGRGLDTARGFGQEQADQFQDHRHNGQFESAPNGTAGTNGNGFTGGSIGTGGATLSNGTSGTPRVGSETRPINNTKRYFIKYQ